VKNYEWLPKRGALFEQSFVLELLEQP